MIVTDKFTYTDVTDITLGDCDSEPITISGYADTELACFPSDSVITIDSDTLGRVELPNTITLGNTVVTEEQLNDLLVLLDVLKEDPVIAEQIAVQIAMNKIAT